MTIKGDEKFQAMQARLADLLPCLNERDRRLALATEANRGDVGELVPCIKPPAHHGRRFGVG
jgi:hypothetical protein